MTVRNNEPDTTKGFSLPRSNTRARVLMLGAVSALALGGAALNTSFVTLPALAEAPLNQSVVPAGPASFADLVDRVKGAVVSVRVKTVQNASSDEEGRGMPQFGQGDPMERFFKQFGGRDQFRSKPHKGTALGSGFIISADGYVVTNNHVVENGSEVELVLDNGKTVAAKIVGTDKKTDLALLKIKDSGTYPFVQFGTKTPRVDN